jgi:hypothetical protein
MLDGCALTEARGVTVRTIRAVATYLSFVIVFLHGKQR